MWSLRNQIFIIVGVFVFLCVIGFAAVYQNYLLKKEQAEAFDKAQAYWFVLYRKEQKEELYHGIPGEKAQSSLIRTFQVKTGIPGERPTPLPSLVGKKYWLIVAKKSTKDDPQTAPYFLTLNVPAPDKPPFGPTPYKECGGKQCDWVTPGAFGLHGVNGDNSRLSKDDPGSSGCIRHKDADITYLYNLLDPKKEEIRYYIDD